MTEQHAGNLAQRFAAATDAAKRRFLEANAAGALDKIRSGWEAEAVRQTGIAQLIALNWERAQNPDRLAGAIVSKSRQDLVGFEQARQIVAVLMARGTPLPKVLQLWTAGVMAGEIKPPKPRGKPPMQVLSRDRMLSNLVRDVCDDFDLTPTRNAAGRTAFSACDATVAGWALFTGSLSRSQANALGGLSYSTVRTAYQRIKPVLPVGGPPK